MTRIPVFISASFITLYWATVVVKSIILGRRIGKDPNVVPRERIGQLTRIIWAPTIMLWLILLWRGVFYSSDSSFQFPVFLNYSAAVLLILATALTFWCWHQMGRSWRIGIDPHEKTQLIVSGPYKYVQHPIYSLSMVIALASFITLPTVAMLLTVMVHIIMLSLEAPREEKYLLQNHGESYRKYQENVGRFVPIFCSRGRQCSKG
jgi:protein-S-isoprenylcysteine O-methyltransferase Ste14